MSNIRETHKVILNLRSVSKSLDKGAILKAESQNESLIELIDYVYDEVAYTYNKSKVHKDAISSIEVFTDEEVDVQYSALLEMITAFDAEELKGKAADNAMIELISQSDPIIKDLLECVLKRDFKCKVGVRAINANMGNIVNIAPYMRCESEKFMASRIVYTDEDGNNHGAIVETKEDGAFNNVEINGAFDDVVVTTRTGRNVKPNIFLNSLSMIPHIDGVGEDSSLHITMHGELLLKDANGNLMVREIGNGRINSWINREKWIISNAKKIVEAKTQKAKDKLFAELDEHIIDWVYTENNMVYVAWDIVDYKDWKALYSDERTLARLLHTETCVNAYNAHIKAIGLNIGNCELRLINYEIVYSEEGAMEFYNKQIALGLEGMVAKNLDAPWMHDVNINGIIKLKDFFECDLLVTGWTYGKPDGEFAEGIGALVCESADGRLIVDVSGMSRDQRGFERVDLEDSSKGIKLIEGFDFEWAVGSIIAVKFNAMIKGADKDTYSLFLPSMLEVRSPDDKSVADSIEKIATDSKFKLK